MIFRYTASIFGREIPMITLIKWWAHKLALCGSIVRLTNKRSSRSKWHIRWQKEFITLQSILRWKRPFNSFTVGFAHKWYGFSAQLEPNTNTGNERKFPTRFSWNSYLDCYGIVFECDNCSYVSMSAHKSTQSALSNR